MNFRCPSVGRPSMQAAMTTAHDPKQKSAVSEEAEHWPLTTSREAHQYRCRDPAPDLPPAARSLAAVTSLDTEASGPSDAGTTPCECRSAHFDHEIASARAVASQNRPASRGHGHGQCEPRSGSRSNTRCATVFCHLVALSGEPRLRLRRLKPACRNGGAESSPKRSPGGDNL